MAALVPMVELVPSRARAYARAYAREDLVGWLVGLSDLVGWLK